MNKKLITVGAFVIASAVIWGAIIIGCSYALKGTECYEKIQNILAAGASSHLILIWGPLSLLLSKKTKEK
jgi:hypothetical protein